MDTLESILETTRRGKPLVHFITNYVTVNDCANMTLAAGGSPIMADDPQEAEDIVSICSALVLNMGTPCERTFRSMLAAGKEANKRGKPVVFDPVGAGASAFRNELAATLLREVSLSVIKGNISEISFLTEGSGTTSGVDAHREALSTENNLNEHVRLAQRLSEKTGAVVAISGPIDIIADSREAWAVRNGHPAMAALSGTGCMSAAVIGCHAGANPQAPLLSCVCGMSGMGICGELAHERCQALNGGTGTYRMLLLDAMSRLDAETLAARSNVQRC